MGLMKKTLNEEVYRIKQVMGLNEALDPITPGGKRSRAQYVIQQAYSGPGTTIKDLVGGFQMIKSVADYQQVEAEEKQFGGYGSLVAMLNGELEYDDLGAAQQIQAALKAAGVNLTFQTEQWQATAITGEKSGKPETRLKEKSFQISLAAPTPAQTPARVTLETPGSWWVQHPALVAYLKATGTTTHFPPMNNIALGAIASERTNGGAWDFFSDGRWYQYKTAEEGLTATTKAEFEGKWSEKGNELIIVATDGDTFSSSTNQWTKPKQTENQRTHWTPETGKFPLLFGQYGPTIRTLQKALGIKADSYFGTRTEKNVKAKASEYNRKTGVTDSIYNDIVNASKPQQVSAPVQQYDTTQQVTEPTPPPPTEAELQANPSTLNPY